jgi:hypothetical protein
MSRHPFGEKSCIGRDLMSTEYVQTLSILNLKTKGNLHLNPLGPFTHTFFMLLIVKIYLALQLSTFNSIAVILMPNDDMFSPHPHFHQFHHYQTVRLFVIFCVPCSF